MKTWMIFLILALGVALGIGGTTFGPTIASSSYVPEAWRMKPALTISGTVIKKQREGDKLRLTVQSSQGAFLATFHKKTTEIDQLVAQGDSITLALKKNHYEPFVDDPSIEWVRK